MTAVARDILAAFDALEPIDQQQVVAELLRRSAGVERLTDAAFDELAVEVFQVYDSEEAAGAGH